ncbi:MAG: glutathione peroxidase [Acidimicrobiales bacterium]
MSIYDHNINSLQGEAGTMSAYKGQTLLIVNVASKCGLTPQYEGLELLHERFRDQGFSVLGFPCNQFGGQEPGTPDEIASFCSSKYGVTFPLTEKIDVNGSDRHPIYEELVQINDAEGKAGDITWNFEKFLIAPDGTIAARYRPMTDPEAPELITAIEKLLSS